MRTSLFSLAATWLAAVLVEAHHPIPTFAPVPPAAVGPELNAAGYRVEDYGDGAFMVTDGSYQSFFLISTKGVIVVDAPPTIGHNIQYAIGNITSIPVTHFIYSHAHGDHSGGSYLFGNNVTRISHKLTKSLLEDAPNQVHPLPNVTFDEQLHLHVGNQTLELAYHGPNHAAGNIFIYAPKQKVLVLIDVVFPGWVPFAYLGIADYVPGLIAAHDLALAYDFDVFIGGHVLSGSRADVELAAEYVRDLEASCAAAIGLSGQPPSPDNPISAQELGAAALAANPNNVWAEYKVYLAEVSEYCGNETSSRWIGRLAAADVWSFENAYAMVVHLRIDFAVLGPFGVSN